MAIINCPECGKEISDKAETCIYCGYPLRAPERAQTMERETPRRKTVMEILADAGRKIGKKGIIVLLIAALVIAGVVASNNMLTENEEYACQVVEKYKRMLKDPDSMVLRGDILYVENSDLEKFVAFSASGNNSYGAPVTSMPMFLDRTYVGDYGDEASDLEDREEKLNLLKGNLAVASWNLVGENMVNDEDYLEAELISGKKIAKKLKCEWKEN